MTVKKLVLASILGGIAMFFWGAISHMALPFYNNAMHGFTDEAAVLSVIILNAPTGGVYFSPYIPQSDMKRGPFMLASIRTGEFPPTGVLLGTQLLTEIFAALFVCLALSGTRNLSYWRYVLSAVLVGLAGFCSIMLPMWTWYGFGIEFTGAEFFDTTLGFIAAGLVIGRFRPVQEG